MPETGKLEAFDGVKHQVGFCGIWCGSCVVGNGALRELASGFRRVVTKYGLSDWGPKDVDYAGLLKTLESIQNLPLCPGCLRSGGRDNCEIRACAKGRGLDDCNSCGEMRSCEHSDLMSHMRTGAAEAGLFVKTEKGDGRPLIEEWISALKTRWPCCVLFSDGE